MSIISEITDELKENEKELEKYEDIVNSEEWGNYKDFFEREYNDKHKDMWAYGIMLSLVEKSICQAKNKALKNFLERLNKLQKDLSNYVKSHIAGSDKFYDDNPENLLEEISKLIGGEE